MDNEVKIEKDLISFVETLKEEWGESLISVVIFGSYVSKMAKPDSDIDLLIVKRSFPKSRLERRKEMHPIYQKSSQNLRDKLSTVLLTPEEAEITKPFYLDMTLYSRILFDRDNFFERILIRLKKRLLELNAQRKRDKDGYPYWILKPDARLGEEIIL